jgi:hypothetical protein
LWYNIIVVYFSIENFKKIKRLDKKTVFSTVLIAVVLALAGMVAVIVLLQERLQERGGINKGEEGAQRRLSDEEKIKILESLSAPSGAPGYTNEEKRQILEGLSAPPDAPKLSDEEKKAILESLSAPTE